MNDHIFVKVGPAGNGDASRHIPWDEKGHTNIVQIYIWHSSLGIHSIQFLYAENGKLVLSSRHGSDNGEIFETVTFTHPSEYITCLGGIYSITDYLLGSLMIGTNHREYGPFGVPTGQETNMYSVFFFRLGERERCQFGGFCGTIDGKGCISSIGVYLKPNVTFDTLHNEIKPKKESEDQ